MREIHREAVVTRGLFSCSSAPGRWDVFENLLLWMFAHPRTSEPKQTQFLMVSVHRTRMSVVFAVLGPLLTKRDQALFLWRRFANCVSSAVKTINVC